MIFISGIHGVGKTFFGERIKEKFGIELVTASSLIEEYHNAVFSTDKKVDNILKNQQALLAALREKETLGNAFLLDGHFCLMKKDGELERIPFQTYKELSPAAIVLLTEKADTIVQRRCKRDGIDIDVKAVDDFQTAEKEYAYEIANKLRIPIFVSSGIQDIQKAIDFVLENV